MSSSEEDSKIDILDSADAVRRKLTAAACEPNQLENNGVLAFIKHVIFSLHEKFVIAGGDGQTYVDYQTLEDDFVAGRLAAEPLKDTLVEYLNRILEPVREVFQDPGLQKLTKLAYPRKGQETIMSDLTSNTIQKSLSKMQLEDKRIAVAYEERWNIITRGLKISGEEQLKSLLLPNHRPPLHVVWSVPTTERLHIAAHYAQLLKVAEMLRADCRVTILLGDVLAYLDNQQIPWELLEARVAYYRAMINAVLDQLTENDNNLKALRSKRLTIVSGTSFQLSGKYALDLYRWTTRVTETEAKTASEQVLKPNPYPFMSELVYPGVVALDEENLNADVQFSGDERMTKMFELAEKSLPILGYKRRIHLMSPIGKL